MSDGLFSNALLNEFNDHAARMRDAARARRAAVQLRACVDDKEDGVAASIWDTLGVRQQNDKWQGDVNLRTLRSLLSLIDGEHSFVQPKALPSLSSCGCVRRSGL
jgi:hypothetical protein